MNVPQQLKEKAIDLSDIGCNELGWEKSNAIELLQHLVEINTFVLGGDVLIKEADSYRHNYDNWYFNVEDGDAEDSVDHAIKYIEEYPSGDYLFVIVVKENLE